MDVPPIFYYLLFFFLGIKVVNFVINVLGGRFLARPISPEILEVNEEQFPSFYKAALSRFEHELTQLGFSHSGFISIKLGSVPGRICNLFYHEEHRVIGLLYLSGNQRNELVPSLNLDSTFEDGKIYSTRNGVYEAQVCQHSHLVIELARGMTIRAQLDLHLKSRSNNQGSGAAVRVTLSEYVSNSSRIFREMWEGLVKDGSLIESKDGSMRFSTKTAAKCGLKFVKPPPPRAAYLIDDASCAEGWDEVKENDAEVALLLNEAPVRSTGIEGILKILGLVSAILFILSFSRSLNFSGALALFVIIGIHEAGHALAMHSFGYKDIKIFFIPFLGGVAVGKPANIPAWKEAIVFFAGPIPGILLGLTLLECMRPTPDSALGNFALMAILINLLNLLPFVPLDGGRIVDLLIPAPLVFIRVLFRLSGVLLLALCSLWAGDNIFFILLALIVISTLRSCITDYRIGTLVRRVRRTVPDASAAGSQQALAEAVVAAIRASVFYSRPLPCRQRVSKEIFSKALVKPLGYLSTPVFASLYLASLVGPPMMLAIRAPQYSDSDFVIIDEDLETDRYQEALRNDGNQTKELKNLLESELVAVKALESRRDPLT